MFLGDDHPDFEYVDKQIFPETWVGMWKKEGHVAQFCQSKALMKCQYCIDDQASRYQPRFIRSYRVRGCTKPGSVWQWWEGVCKNPDRCWGLKDRFWMVLKSNSGQWVFRTYIKEENDPNLSNIDELRVTLEQGKGDDRLL